MNAIPKVWDAAWERAFALRSQRKVSTVTRPESQKPTVGKSGRAVGWIVGTPQPAKVYLSIPHGYRGAIEPGLYELIRLEERVA